MNHGYPEHPNWIAIDQNGSLVTSVVPHVVRLKGGENMKRWKKDHERPFSGCDTVVLIMMSQQLRLPARSLRKTGSVNSYRWMGKGLLRSTPRNY